MNSFRMLIVEDDGPQIKTWERQIARFNAHKDLDFTADYAATQESAAQLIDSNKYDAAIIDIRLQNSKGVKDATSGGNEVRDLLLKSEVVLVAHVTGEPGAVHYDDSKYEGLVRIFTKGDSAGDDPSIHEEILDWVLSKIDILSTMKTVKSNISEKMADLFYSSIWPRWDSWKGDGANMDFIPLSVARHMSSHLYSTFLEGSDGRVHPEEWYFQPPSKERFHTGDLIKNDDKYYVLVTPRCDLERICADETLLFARLDLAENWLADIESLNDKITALEAEIKNSVDQKQIIKKQSKIDTARTEFRKNYYGHKQNNFKYHFLPEVNQTAEVGHGPFFVDFSNIMTVAYGSDVANAMIENKVASISPEFIPSLVQRLGAFMSRIGSPDYSHVY